jgi:hypothetical protein
MSSGGPRTAFWHGNRARSGTGTYGNGFRHPNPADHRSTLVRLSAGTPRLNYAEQSLSAELDALTACLTDQDSATVAAFLTTLTERFERRAAAERARSPDKAGSPCLWGLSLCLPQAKRS